jgi:hypothetical protein
MGCVLTPRLKKKRKKRIPLNLGSQKFATMGPNKPPKMLKVGPKFFSALTPSVKRARAELQR